MAQKSKFEELRKKAEEILAKTGTPVNVEEYRDSIMRLVEELSVSQIELELQNQELRESQLALTHEKERFADLYFNAPVGYFLINRKGIIADINHKAAEILETPAGSAKGNPFSAYLKKKHSILFFDHLNKVFEAQEEGEKELELAIANKKGEIRYLRLTSNLFQEDYCRTLAEDFTEEYLAQERVAQLNARLEGSMRAGNMAWWELELPSGELHFNENKALMLGRKPEEFNHYTDFMGLVHPDDYAGTMEAFKQHVYGNKPRYECEYRIRNAKGEYLWFHDVGKVVKRQEKSLLLTGIVTDITYRKEAQAHIKSINGELRNTVEELKTSNEKLSEANATKDLFFNILAHDLKNPFSNILGFSELLLANTEKYDKAKIKDFIGKIHKSSVNTYKLLENLLEWARAQQGKIPFTPGHISLYYVVYETVVLVRSQADAKHIRIEEEVDQDLHIYADSEMMKTIVRNFLSNAIKYTGQGGSVSVKAEEKGDDVHITITDTGMGMDEETRSGLFKIGGAHSRQGTAGEEGTGFGLMICKQFVDKHKGTIEVTSEAGKGSTFLIRIPAQGG